MKYPGYFLIVADFIQWAKSQGHSGRAGPRLGRGLARRLCAHHHRPRSDPLRPPVRALPQSGARVDAGLRHRLLPGAARRGDPLRAGALRPRSGRRRSSPSARCRRAACCATSGACSKCRTGRSTSSCKLVPMNPAAPVTLSKAIAEEPRLQAARDAEPVVKRAFDIAMKLEGLHRHASTHAAGIVIGDRPLAELVPMYRDPKSDMPVTQFNMKWVEQAGLVKFDFLGLKTLTVLADGGQARRPARHRSRSSRAFRSTMPRATQMLARGETVGIFQVEGQGMRRALTDMQPGPLRGHHRAGRALPAGPDGEHPDLLRAQARQGAARIHPSEARADAARDLRDHHLPGAGDGDRAASLRLLARRGRPPAPRHGQEDPQRDGGAAQALRRRRGRGRRREGAGGGDLRGLREICRLRFQQEPRGGLCAASPTRPPT